MIITVIVTQLICYDVMANKFYSYNGWQYHSYHCRYNDTKLMQISHKHDDMTRTQIYQSLWIKMQLVSIIYIAE